MAMNGVVEIAMFLHFTVIGLNLKQVKDRATKNRVLLRINNSLGVI